MANSKTARADADSPEVFNLNAVKVEADDFPPFYFNWGPKNRRWRMTHRELLNQLPVAEAAVRGGELEGSLVILQEALGPEQWAEFRKIKIVDKQSEALLKAYFKHCGVELGESSGSTDS